MSDESPMFLANFNGCQENRFPSGDYRVAYFFGFRSAGQGGAIGAQGKAMETFLNEYYDLQDRGRSYDYDMTPRQSDGSKKQYGAQISFDFSAEEAPATRELTKTLIDNYDQAKQAAAKAALTTSLTGRQSSAPQAVQTIGMLA